MEGLSLTKESGDTWIILAILDHLAELAVEQGRAAQAARLAGAERAAREALQLPIPPVEQAHLERP